MNVKKKTRIITACSVLIVVLAAATVLLTDNINLSPKTDHTPYSSKYKTASPDSYSEVRGDRAVMENNRFRFEMDTASTHFKITDLTTGTVYSSVPENITVTVSDEAKVRIQSELTLTYYNEESKSQYMGSGPGSVDPGNFKILKNGNRLRVVYTFGTPSDAYFVPQAFEKDFFENSILPKITKATDLRRIKRYYKLFDPADQNEAFKEMVSEYPVIKDRPVYLFADSSESKDVMKDVTGYMKTAGYTEEQYKKDAVNFNLSEAAVKVPTGFVVPVEYELTDTGFRASVLNDQIKENKETDKIVEVSLLEYFNASDGTSKQTYLVPDGSGALIDTTTENGLIYSQPLYGRDEAVQEQTIGAVSQKASFPVFGAYGDHLGYLAVVEGGSAQATVKAKTRSGSSPMNTLFCDFQIRGMMTTDIGKDRNIPVINLYGKHIVYDYPVLNYIFLNPGEQDYSGMALVYRSYLKGEKALPENEFSEDLPFFLDFTCLITKDTQIMGLSYKKKIVLADYEGMAAVVKKLHEAGITNLVVRLKGTSPDGMSQGVANRFALSNKIGTQAQLDALVGLIVSKGGKVYFEGNFMEVYRDRLFDAFKPKSDSAYYLDRNLVKASDFDRVTGEYNTKILSRYLVSPLLLPAWAKSFTEFLSARFSSVSAVGVAWADAGTRLYSDFNYKKDFDRSMSMDSITTALHEITSAKRQVLVEGGNLYSLAYTSGILSAGYQNSFYPIEKASVPFYQMVVHGSVSYTGPAMNQISDQRKAVLKNLEFGGGIYYDWITGEDTLLKSTDYESGNFSLHDTNSIQDAIKNYLALNEQTASLQKETMVKHEIIGEDVTVTTYSNGIRIIVNYGSVDADLYGTTVKNHDYKVIQGDIPLKNTGGIKE